MRNVDDSGGPDACWIWRGHHTHQGYAYGSRTTAHREIYERLVGPIPDGLEIDHLCRNRGCVNPAHMEPVTHQENIRRSKVNSERCRSMGRANSKLTPEDVIEMRKLHTSGVMPTELGSLFGIHRKSVSRIITGKRWAVLS